MRTQQLEDQKAQHQHFNSIKVRLEPESPASTGSRYPFQFHKGTIRTLCRRIVLLQTENFNSIKVRLERTTLAHILREIIISIP